MMLKSGYCNEHSAVRPVIAPGPLRKACGFRYQEYSTIHGMKLKDNAFGLGNDNSISTWYEFIEPETAKPLAYADHPFFGQWPAVTVNEYGKGKLYYIGTYPNQTLMNRIVRMAAVDNGALSEDAPSFPIIKRRGTNGQGKKVEYIFNYSGKPMEVRHDGDPAVNLLTGDRIDKGDTVSLGAWDVAILRSR